MVALCIASCDVPVLLQASGTLLKVFTAVQKELHQLQQHLLLVKHAAHQHGVEHSSKLGSMLYDNDVAFVAESNSTDVRTASWQDEAVPAAADQSSNAHAQGLDVQNVSDTGSRHEMPHRTHHHVQQSAASP